MFVGSSPKLLSQRPVFRHFGCGLAALSLCVKNYLCSILWKENKVVNWRFKFPERLRWMENKVVNWRFS
jgi:hypothetical protein